MQEQAAEHGIRIIGFGSDGDTRLLNAMHNLTFTNLHQTSNWTWFVGNLDDLPACVQDHVHIGTKFRTRLLAPSILLPMGDYVLAITCKRVDKLCFQRSTQPY